MKVLPTLRQLRYLVAVAEHKHFGRAAAECLVTQSSLSAGIRELETALGVTLIGRSRRSVTLSPLGEEIVERAAGLLAAAEELVDAVHAGSRPLTGLLRLGIIPTIAPYLLPLCLAGLRRDYPALRLYLREEPTARLLELLARGRLDAAVIALPYETGGLPAIDLGRDALVVACPRGHPLAGRERVSAGDLQGEPLLLLEDGHCLRAHTVTMCRLLPGQRNEQIQATSLATLVPMVAGGFGVAVLPAMAVAAETAREPGVVCVPFEGDDAEPTIALVWRPGSARAREFGLLAEALRLRPASPCGPVSGTD